MNNVICLLVVKKDVKTALYGIQKNVHYVSLISLKKISLVCLSRKISLASKKKNVKALSHINLTHQLKLVVFQCISMEKEFVIIVD